MKEWIITFTVHQLEQGIILGIRNSSLVCDDATDLFCSGMRSHRKSSGLQGSIVLVRNDDTQDRGAGRHCG